MKRTILKTAAVLFMSALLNGQSNAEVKPYKVSNYPSHNSTMIERLVAGRVYVYERKVDEAHDAWNRVQGSVFSKDGSLHQCFVRSRNYWRAGIYGVVEDKWLVTEGKLKLDVGAKRPVWRFPFYRPQNGGLTLERYSGKSRKWTVSDSGWIQGSWPRVLADACPKLRLPTGLKINEKQTSLRMDELRRQDPDAVIRHFPGSHLTGPGRIGIAAHGLPTTNRDEVWAFLNGQEGNVILGPKGHGRVFVRGAEGADRHEIWGLKDEGGLAWTAELAEVADGGADWLHWEFDGKVVARYRMGDPLPYLATGHRHGAFQLTDRLIGGAEAMALPFMGDAYADRRFVFIGDGNLSVVDLDGNLAPDEGFEGTWRWTKGRLEVRVAGDGRVHGIGWQDLARELGVKPALVTRAALNGRRGAGG